MKSLSKIMAHVRIQKINLYDLDMEPPSSDEEDTTVQKQPKINSMLKPAKSQTETEDISSYINLDILDNMDKTTAEDSEGSESSYDSDKSEEWKGKINVKNVPVTRVTRRSAIKDKQKEADCSTSGKETAELTSRSKSKGGKFPEKDNNETKTTKENEKELEKQVQPKNYLKKSTTPEKSEPVKLSISKTTPINQIAPKSIQPAPTPLKTVVKAQKLPAPANSPPIKHFKAPNNAKESAEIRAELLKMASSSPLVPKSKEQLKAQAAAYSASKAQTLVKKLLLKEGKEMDECKEGEKTNETEETTKSEDELEESENILKKDGSINENITDNELVPVESQKAEHNSENPDEHENTSANVEQSLDISKDSESTKDLQPKSFQDVKNPEELQPSTLKISSPILKSPISTNTITKLKIKSEKTIYPKTSIVKRIMPNPKLLTPIKISPADLGKFTIVPAKPKEPEVTIKHEAMDVEDSPVIQQTWQNIDVNSFIKQEEEMIVPPEDLMEMPDVKMEKQDSLPIEQEFLDEKGGFLYKGTSTEEPDDILQEFQDENPPKKIKLDEESMISYLPTLPSGITVKRTLKKQVACKSTSKPTEGIPVGPAQRVKPSPFPQLVKIGKRIVNASAITYSNGEKQIRFGNKIVKILDKSGHITENANVLSGITVKFAPDRYEGRDPNFVKGRKSPKQRVAVKYNHIGRKQVDADDGDMNTEFVNEKNDQNEELCTDIEIKEEPIDEIANSMEILNEYASESEANSSRAGGSNFITLRSNSVTSKPDSWFSNLYSQSSIESAQNAIKSGQIASNTSDSGQLPTDYDNVKIKIEKPSEDEFESFDMRDIKQEPTEPDEAIVSTKVVSIPPSQAQKPKRIIVVKRPFGSSAVKPGTSSSPTATGSIRYIVKSPTTNPTSKLHISNISGAQAPPSIPTTVTFQKSNTKITVNKQNPIYRCHKCHLLFTSHDEYTQHLKEHKNPILPERRIIKLEELHQMNQFQCAQCNAGFPSIEKLSAHENRHKTEFTCKYCNKKFLIQYRYKEHLLQHEKRQDKYIECKLCDRRFLKEERYKEHMNIHFPRETFPCGTCGKEFGTSQQLNDHQKSEHNKKFAMKCGLCSYETCVKQNFEKHANMHMRYVEKITSSKFFKCDQCPQSFREQSVLDIHKSHVHGP